MDSKQLPSSPWYTDPDQPHVLVYYDETYLATGDANYEWTDRSGRLKQSCQQIYVPWRLIQFFHSLHQAFGFFTKKAEIHFADYEADLLYQANGEHWSEENLTHFPSLGELPNYLTQ